MIKIDPSTMISKKEIFIYGCTRELLIYATKTTSFCKKMANDKRIIREMFTTL